MPNLSEPNGVDLRSFVDIALDLGEWLPTPIRHLSMQQDPPVLIANNDGYGAMPQSIAMRLELGRRSDRDIVSVNDDHFI